MSKEKTKYVINTKRENKKTEISKRIRQALSNTKEIKIGDKDYISIQLQQRIEGPTNAGSSYEDVTEEELLQKLNDAEWEQVEHEGVMSGCTAFKTKLPGLSGILNIDNLPEDAEFYAIDPKGVGKVGIGAANVQKTAVEETYIILGEEEGKEVVFTFHPGEPVPPSMVEAQELPHGIKLTREQVQSYGFGMAKFISEDMKKEFDEINQSIDKEDSTLTDLARTKVELKEKIEKAEELLQEYKRKEKDSKDDIDSIGE